MKISLLKLLVCAAILCSATVAGCSDSGTSGTTKDEQQPNAVTRSVDETQDDGNGDTQDETKPSEAPDEKPNDFPPPPQPRGEFPRGGKHIPLPHHRHGERKAPPEKDQPPTEENNVYN